MRLGYVISDLLVLEDKYENLVVDINKSAIEKYGSDSNTFKKYLEQLNAKKSLAIENFVESASTSDLLGNWSYILNNKFEGLYVNCYCAISQLSLSIPGILEEFPEAVDFIRKEGRNMRGGMIKEELDNYINNYNRFSKKFDFDYLKSIIGEIEEDTRLDDYICKNIISLYKNDKLKEYIKKYFIWEEVLTEDDIEEILIYAFGIDFDTVKKEKDIVSYYFSNMDDYIPSLDIKNINPDMMKKINQTVLYAKFGTF